MEASILELYNKLVKVFKRREVSCYFGHRLNLGRALKSNSNIGEPIEISLSKRYSACRKHDLLSELNPSAINVFIAEQLIF